MHQSRSHVEDAEAEYLIALGSADSKIAHKTLPTQSAGLYFITDETCVFRLNGKDETFVTNNVCVRGHHGNGFSSPQSIRK